ncbi:Aldo/keto reductase [Artomyces pyxidatus]|uniref:Aldo/keto reductase n=1 Tax=Artomyces pyxidatus TaxID=48021 RepID=A0ACB8T8X7_9AGAM|nr:Aldo/keto reductase [Artomyces pyxidatus]
MPARIPLLLGTANFGAAGKTGVRVSDVATAQAIVDKFVEKYTEVDTAKLYGDGTAEELFGKIDLKGATIDTKIDPDQPGGHEPKALRASLDVSLKALLPHKICVYYLHMPDRRVSYEDTLRQVNTLYKEGKFNALGLSNYPAWEVVEIINICKSNGWVLPTYYQGVYNVITRGIEPELVAVARKYGLRIITYSPLAGGFLTGRIKSKDAPVDSLDQFNAAQGWLGATLRTKYLKDSQFEALAVIKEVADKHGIPLIEVGYRWLQHHSLLQPGDGIVFGASSVEHLETNIAAAEQGPLPDEVLEAVNIAYKIVGHDAPSYFL